MKATAIPMLRLENQRLTSFAGLVVLLQRFFQLIALKTRLRQCFRHVAKGKIYDPTAIFLQLIVHLVLGFRELRDVAHYRDDPLVQRLLGLCHLPNVATISRIQEEGGPQLLSTVLRAGSDGPSAGRFASSGQCA